MKKNKLKDTISKNKEVDVNIRKAFGKYYIFSIVLMIFMIIFPFILKYIKIWFAILLLVFFLVFFIFMILDLFKKKKKYWNSLASIFILFFIIVYSLDILKIVFFLIK